MARSEDWRTTFTFGGRVPWSIGLVLSITVAASIVSALGSLFPLLSLDPAAVWRGQVWRLVTWPFVEPTPFGLLFGCLMIWMFGRNLAPTWGSRTFLRVFGGATLAASVGTCLVGLVDPAVWGATYLGTWTWVTAITIGWGLTFPTSEVRIYFVLPIRGYWLAWLTVGITVLFCVYYGWTRVLPELIAEAVVLAWIYRGPLTTRWTRLRRSVVSSGPARRGSVVEVRFPKRTGDANREN